MARRVDCALTAIDRVAGYDREMSPKSKRELARQHLETARADLDGERYGDALNAMFHAAEAAVVWLDPDELREHLAAVELLVLDAEALR